MRPIPISLFIIVAGLLTAITIPAVWDFVGSREASVMVEMDQLQTAMQTYCERHSEHPPCLNQISPALRGEAFMRHLTKAFPKSNYGTTALDYHRLRASLQSDKPSDITQQAYNYRNVDGVVRPLDLDTLDAAESLVFWLGGFPTPYHADGTATVSNRRLFGFDRDASNPLRRDSAVQEEPNAMINRTELLYQFDETRLVDRDYDGWWEYIPVIVNDSSEGTPFVYFDATCYEASTDDDASIGTVVYPRHAELAGKIGQISPFAETFDPAQPKATKWQKPESFQIVCGGKDNRFGPPARDAANACRIALWPAGITFESPNGQNFSLRELADEEKDNLSNLDNVPLGTAMKQRR